MIRGTSLVVATARLLAGERGMALVLTLGLSLVLGISGTTAFVYTTGNARASAHSSADERSFSLSEGAINNAMAVLSNPSNNALDPDLLPANEATAQQAAYEGGTAKWWGVLNRTTAVWTLYGVGIHDNPTGPGTGQVRRMLTARVPVTPVAPQDLAPNNQAWQYMFATRTGNACDMTLNNHVSGSTRLYANGNLCIQNNADYLGEALIVKGNLTLGNGSQVGSPSSMSTRTQTHVGGVFGCKYHNAAWHNPCSDVDNVFSKKNPPNWVTGVNHEPPTVAAPAIDMAGWYENAMPGPSQSCSTTSGTPPMFDNNYPLRDNSAPTFELTPATHSYLCRVGQGASSLLIGPMTATQTTVVVASAVGFPTSPFRVRIDNEQLDVTGGFGTNIWTVTRGVGGTTAAPHSLNQTVNWVTPSAGELSWNHLGKTLTINGVVYIDGSAAVSSNLAQYSGQGVLYLSGMFTVTGKLCGGTAGGSCDFATWNPNTELLTVVADAAGGTMPYGVEFGNSAQFQGALYSSSAIFLGNDAHSDGPMVGATIVLSNHVDTDSFPWITTVPPGMPGNPNVYAQPNSPQLFAG